MSAYVVHADTINLIVAAGYRYAKTSGLYMSDAQVRQGEELETVSREGGHASFITDAEAIAKVLYAENVHSVNARYRLNDAADGFAYKPLDLDWAAAGVDPRVLVLQSIRCLRYQSCESSDYEQSAGALILEIIEHAVIRSLCDDMPWGWTSAWTNERRAEIKAQSVARV